MAKAAPPADPIRFEDVLGRLRTLVERLEGGNLPLEEGLQCFEEGMALCHQGAEILDAAEKRVEILMSTAGESPRTEPFGEAATVSEGE